jgi:quinol monooxygenase YgiN
MHNEECTTHNGDPFRREAGREQAVGALRPVGMMRRSLLLCVSLVTSALIGGAPVNTLAQPPQRVLVVRLAELQIDPVRLDEYKAALSEEIEASIRLEEGVLTLYAVSVKGHPAQIRLFEMYADQAAYEAHLNTPHFVKYKTGTRHMVQSLVLVETDPILLGAKPRLLTVAPHAR